MQKDKIDEICTKMGAIFHTENKRVRINEPCLCEHFKESGIYCYIRPLKIFEYYDHTTGKTVRISDDEIRTRLRAFAAGLRGNISITNINLALSYRVLCSALQMFKDAVGTDIYPEATRFCIHTRNGILVYDQELKNFRLRDFSPEIISRSMINRVYNPKAECPMFIEKLLKPMLRHPEDDLDTLQQLFGQYLLRENLSQQFLVISGPAGVGKSVLVSVIERILGLENITEFQPSRLSNPFEMVEYSNKHLLTAKDVENDALSKGINALKKITGNDYLALEKKHSNERVYVRGNFNIIITGNGDLTIDFGAGRDAFARRLIWEEDCQLLILGTGEPQYERFFRELAQEFPDRVCAKITFDLGLASRIYAGGDIYLMPSKSEPCGLSQMNAMRYGTVPVVHATGGLRDTVPGCDQHGQGGLGFTFQSYNADDFLASLKRALGLYHYHREGFRELQRHDMRQDFSWDVPAGRYMDLFYRMLSW